MSSSDTKPPTRPRNQRHLMVPGQPQPQVRSSMSIGRVQRWVLSVVAVSTILHMAAGLVIAAMYVDKTSSQVGLLVIAGAFGVLAVVSGLVIHQRRWLSPWLALGVIPTVVGAFLVF